MPLNSTHAVRSPQSSDQAYIPAELSSGPGQMTQPSADHLAALTTRVSTLAASLRAPAVPLVSTSNLYQAGLPEHGVQNFTGTLYVATPQLLATYGIKASQVAPGTDILTRRPGLAGLPHLELIGWGNGYISDAARPRPRHSRRGDRRDGLDAQRPGRESFPARSWARWRIPGFTRDLLTRV